jgi:hypothetical protein
MPVATKERLEHMLDVEKLEVEEIARRLKIHRDSVYRAMRKHKLLGPRRQRPLTGAEIARVKLLGAEGMPANWIAEDVRCATCTVHAILGNRPDAARQWRAAWSGIRHHDELYLLHNQIAPPARKESFTHLRSA